MDVQYEYETVKVLKGREAKTISGMEESGWELVSQEPSGILRTSIGFRRVKKQMPKNTKILIGAAGAVAIVALAVAAIFESGDVSDPAEADVTTTPTVEPTSDSSVDGISVPVEPSASEVAESIDSQILTVENNTKLAAVMSDGDSCSSEIADFADDFEGRTIRFDGNVGALNNHGNYTTRYDILIGFDDFDPNSQPGPSFQFRDVNTTSDLNYSNSDIPNTIGIGDNVRVTAKVVRYEPRTCLFLLEPVETEIK